MLLAIATSACASAPATYRYHGAPPGSRVSLNASDLHSTPCEILGGHCRVTLGPGPSACQAGTHRIDGAFEVQRPDGTIAEASACLGDPLGEEMCCRANELAR